jgi:predicted nucleic acid-binding protein
LNYIYDASFIGALIIPDEKNLNVEKAHLTIKKSGEIFSPQLLWYEITNIFNNLIRCKRYTYNEVIPFFPIVFAIGLITDSETNISYSKKIFHLSNDYNLSSYDAAYLELAERKNAILCTLDNKLKTSAKKHGVIVMNIE